MSARIRTIEQTMLGAALLTAMTVTAGAQTAPPGDATAARPHRIVLPLPRSEAGTGNAAAPAATTAPTMLAQNETPAAGDASTPNQAAGQAAVAALMREMAALRPSNGTTTATVKPAASVTKASATGSLASSGVPTSTTSKTSTTSTMAAVTRPTLTGVARPEPEVVTSTVSPRTTETEDVLGNLAPPATATPDAAAPDAAATPAAATFAATASTPAPAQVPMVMGRGGARPAMAPAPAAPAAAAAAAVPTNVPAVPRPRPQAPAAVERALTVNAATAEPAMPYAGALNAGGAAAGMTGNFVSSEAAEQGLHVMVGRSIFIDTKHRLTRVYVTDPTVLNSYTANPNQIVVTALKAGASTLMVWDEAGQTQAYVISADLNVDALQRALSQGFPQDSIHVEGVEEKAVLSGYVGTEEDAINAGKLSLQFTKSVTNSLVVNSSRVKQVRLKVRIVEVDRSKLAQFGFNFFTSGSKNFTVGSTSTGQFSSTVSATGTQATISNPLNFSLYSAKLDIGATLQDLAAQNIAQILAEPTITAMSGQKANFLAGGQFPFPVVQSSGGSSAATVTLQFMPYGVKLDFTPKVNPDGTIDLKVAPEVSALDYANAVTLAGYTVPAISTRRADTELVLVSGQSFAISGLLDQRITDVLDHTPGIASVPILGELFKSKNLNHSIGELVVLVTPTLVDPVAEAREGAEIPLPQPVVPFLDKGKFDHDLPKGEKKQQ